MAWASMRTSRGPCSGSAAPARRSSTEPASASRRSGRPSRSAAQATRGASSRAPAASASRTWFRQVSLWATVTTRHCLSGSRTESTKAGTRSPGITRASIARAESPTIMLPTGSGCRVGDASGRHQATCTSPDGMPRRAATAADMAGSPGASGGWTWRQASSPKSSAGASPRSAISASPKFIVGGAGLGTHQTTAKQTACDRSRLPRPRATTRLPERSPCIRPAPPAVQNDSPRRAGSGSARRHRRGPGPACAAGG